MGEEYKISLGVQLDIDDIQNQINGASKNIKPIEIKVDTEAKELTKSIQEALSSLSKGTKNALTLNTDSLEASLKDVSASIKDIRTSLGMLDSKSGMKNLLSSINQISAALDKASNQFESLNANLNALSGKDLNLNFGINIGGSNPIGRNAAYGSKVRNETLPQLKQQMNDLVKYYNSTYKESLSEFEALQKMVSGTKLNTGDFFETFLFGKDSVASRMSGGSLASQMQAYKQYIDMFKQAASLRGLDITSVTSQFSKSADDLIQDAQDIQTGAKEMEDGFEKLKQVFGGGNNINVEGISNQLDSIVADLGEIKNALQSLSSGASLEGLTQSFDKLSDTIEKLVSNVTLAKTALGEGFTSGASVDTGVINKIEKASDDSTAAIIQNEKKKQEAYKATADAVVYHAGVVSKLNKAETNGKFYGSNRGTGYFGTGHYFVDSATKHELDNSSYSKLPYTSVDMSKYDNLFRVTSDEIGYALHSFLSNLTRFTQGSDNFSIDELFAQFKSVFGDTIMDIQEFGSRLDQLKTFMTNSNLYDRSDSVSTQFMKSLGYGGVDTRGTSLADTRYGTVIYDLKEESILQANITDELQKQGQMLEKINYEKGQVFDKDEDARIQRQLDEQAVRREIAEEFEKSFDATKLDKSISDLDKAREKINEIDEIIKNCQYSLNNLDEEYKEYSKDMLSLGIDDDELWLYEDEDEWKESHSKIYQDRINELNQEKAELQSKIPVLEDVYNRENQLAQEAYEQARQTVEQRHLEARQVEETANTIVQSEERKQQAIRETAVVAEKLDNISIDISSGNVDDLRSALKNLKVDDTSIENATKELGELNIVAKSVSGTLKDGKLAKWEIKGVQTTIDGIERAVTITKTLGQEGWSSAQKYSQALDKAEIEAKELDASVDKVVNKLKTGFDGNTNFDEEISNANTKFSKLANQSDELKVKLEGLRQSFNDIKAANDAINTADNTEELIAAKQRLIEASEAYERSLKDIQNQLKINKNIEDEQRRAEKEANNAANFELDKKKAMQRLDGLFGKNTEAARRFGSELNRLQKEIAECGDDSGLRKLNKQIDILQANVKQTNVKTDNFASRFKKQWSQYSSYFSVASLFMYAEQGLQSMFEQVKLIDSAMTELKKVTNETDASYNQFLSNAASRAKELGTTIDGLVSSTADFARLGYGFKESQGLAEVANVYAVVGDEIDGVEDATQSLVSTLAAYKNEMNGMSDSDFAMSIVDKMNEVSNNYAISSGGLGEALQRSASSMAAANNTLDETIALITAANTVAQNPEKVGNAFKTMSMRIRGAKTELEEAGESTEGMADSTASLRKEILALSGVDIMLNEDTFKSTYDIMDELSQKWEDLSDIAQASITELVAGKHQGNVMSSLMANFDIARKAMDTSLASSGSAMAEHAKWSESLEARLNKLKAAWQGLSQTFMKSDFLKSSIDIIIKLVDVLDKLIDSFGSFGTIALGFGITGFVKNFSTLKTVIKDAFVALTTNAMDSYDAFMKWSKASDGVISGGKKLASSMSAITGTIGLVVAAIGLAYNAYKNAKEEAAKLRQETIQASDAYLDAATSFERAYIKYSGKTDLTAEEEEELASAINGTVDALGEKSSALQDAVNASGDYLASLERIAQEELKTSKRKAQDKLDAAEEELAETAVGWSKIDGGEVNVKISSGAAPDSSEVAKVAKEIGEEYYEILNVSGTGTTSTVGFELSENADIDEIVDYYNMLLEYQDRLRELGLDDTDAFDNVTSAIAKMEDAVGTYIEALSDAKKLEYQYSNENGIPKTVEAYLKMREEILNSEDVSALSVDARKEIANSLDSDYSKVFDLSSAKVQARKFIGILNEYGDTEANQVETFLNMRTSVNDDECTVGQYLSELDKISSMTAKWSDESKKEFDTSFGLDTDSIKKQYQDVYNYVSRNYLSKIDTAGIHGFEAQEFRTVEINKVKDLLNSLSVTELRAVANIKGEINWETTNIEDIRKQIKDEAMFVEAMEYTIAIDVETEGIEAFNTAMAESVSGAGLSSETIKALKDRYADLESQGYNLSEMFEETSNGIHLNRKAVDEFEQAITSRKLSEADGQLKILKDRYDELAKEIDVCVDAGERAALYTEQQSVIEKINDLATLTAQYEGLTSAYNAWQNAESSAPERDMYENILSGFETVEDEISRGWVDDGTKEFLRLLYGDKTTITKIVDGKKVKKEIDIATASASDLKQAYKELDSTIKHTAEGKHKGYSISDFFTVDEDGNSTSKGVYNFLDAIGHMEEEVFGGKDVVKRNKNGDIIGFDFELVAKKDKKGNVIKNGDQVIAEALGISEELVQIMLRTADDAGFVINLEGAYTQLADLKTKAESARDSLISLKKDGVKRLSGVDVNFDLNAEGNDLVKEQEKAVNLLDKFKKDGKINLKLKGAQEALDVAEYLTIKLDDLTEPKFMQIDTSEVDEDLQKPIEKMQEVGKLCKEKHLVTLTGDTKEIEKVQKKINAAAKEIEELEPEIKAQIGIDDNWNAKTIADKIEKGEIEIPAEIKLDVQMSQDLKDMRLMMMRELGLVSDSEVKLKIGYNIDDSKVDELTEEEKEITVKFISENESWFNTLTEDEKEIVIELVAKNEGEFDKLTKEEKEVVVELSTDDSALKALENHQVEIEAFAKIFGVDKVDDLKEKLDGLTDKQILLLAEVIGRTDVEKLKTVFAELDDKTVEAVAKALGEGDVDSLKTTINSLDDKTVQAIAEAFGYNSVDELNTAIDNLSPKTVQAIAQALGIKDVDSLKAAIDRLDDKSVDAIANVDGKDDVDNLKTSIDNLKGKTITVWAGIKKKASDLWDKLTGDSSSGESPAAGTAYASGSTSGRAYSRGDWGIKGNGVALGGELGREIVVRDGKFFTIGDNGAEFFRYKNDDIVFNAAQTESLLKYGGIKGANPRGKLLASGTAFVGGSSGTGGGILPSKKSYTITDKKKNDKDKKKSKKSDKTDSSAKDEFEEVIDWIEIAIDRIERDIDRLEQKAGNIFKSWSSRNNALTKEISKVREEIELQEKAAQRYLKEANSVGLSSSYAEKVRNGKIDISTIKDEALAEKIGKYQDWYEKYLDCIDAAEELKETESELYAQRVENVATQYEGILSVIEHEKNILDEYIAQSEANAQLVSVNYYNALASNERENLAKLKEEKDKMLSEMQIAMDSGTITEGSEAWYNLVNSIDEVTLAIAESNTQLKDYAQTIQQLNWETFDLLQDKISSVTEETDFLIELMSSDKLYNDNGKMTDSGMATMGQHGVAYNTHMYQAELASAEAERLRKELENDPFDTELEERYREMISLQQEHILAAQDEKEAIRDMVEEGIELELDALQELIDKHNEALDSQKDLYDYQKKVKEQTEEIASLEKQIASYSGDTSEESRAKIQELKVSLEEANSNLEESEYDRYITDQQQLLDELYLEYETILNTRLDNLDALVSDMTAEINASAILISNTLSEKADSVGYTLSDSMTTIWDTNSTKINSVITTYGEKFSSAQTTTNNALNTINANLQNMIIQLNSIAKTNVKSASTSSAANPQKTTGSTATTTTTTTKTNTSKTQTTASKTIKAGGKINAGSAKIYDYAGDKSGETQYFKKDPVYKVLKTDGNWLQVRWHKLSSGVTGWFKKGDVKAYATGTRKISSDDVAWTQENGGKEFIVRPSDGAILTPVAKGDSVLNANASGNIWDMANSPAQFIKDNLRLDSSNVPNNSTVQSNYTQHLDKVVFNFPNVKNYDEMLSAMQKDKNFERLISSMTFDKMTGKNSLSKGKSIR